LWILLPTFVIFYACEKSELIEPQDEAIIVAEETTTKSGYDSRPVSMQIKTLMLLKKPWVYGEVFHENPEIQTLLENMLADMQFDFTICGTYRIVIPSIDRDDIGRWKFNEDGTQITFDEDTEGEHFVDIIELNFRNLKYTFDDPALGPWELHLVPYYHRWHEKLDPAPCF